MKVKIDSKLGTALSARRFATVEPVVGHVRSNLRLDRFTHRGRRQVDRPWKRYGLAHNIDKLAPQR